LYLSSPKNYSIKDTISYPVLDGKFGFFIIKGTRMFFEKDTEYFILVGINASDIKYKYEAYTTAVSASENKKRKKNAMCPKGGLNLKERLNFLKPLKPRSPHY
jgi:hypothetical protein